MNKSQNIVITNFGENEMKVVQKLEEFRDLILPSQNSNTRRAYLRDFQLFRDFCNASDLPSLSANLDTAKTVITRYVEFLLSKQLTKGTIKRKLSAISFFYAIADLSSANPVSNSKLFKEYLRGRLNKLDEEQKQANAFKINNLDEFNKSVIGREMGLTLSEIRDAAIVNLAFDTMLRASNITQLRVSDLKFGNNLVFVRRSKTDQDGKGSYRFMSDQTELFCKKWIEKSKITEGFLFRKISKSERVGECLTYDGLLYIIKRIGKKIGLKITCHSTRVGAAVSLYESGEKEIEIMRHGGWKSIAMVARYTETAKLKIGGMAKLRSS
jgi:integrase